MPHAALLSLSESLNKGLLRSLPYHGPEPSHHGRPADPLGGAQTPPLCLRNPGPSSRRLRALALQWCEAHHPRHGRPDCLTQEQYDLLADTPENMAMGSVGPNGQKIMY